MRHPACKAGALPTELHPQISNMTQQYFYTINRPVSDFIKNTDIIPTKPVHSELFVTKCNPKLYLQDDVYDKLSSLGDLFSLVFCMSPNADKKNIHIDIDTDTQKPIQSSLNIIIDGQGVMRWFNPSVEGTLKNTINSNGVNVYYKAWYDNFGDPIDEWKSGKIALVRTDVPHQAWNFDSTDRRIVSIRWSKKYTWKETIEWFETNFGSRLGIRTLPFQPI